MCNQYHMQLFSLNYCCRSSIIGRFPVVFRATINIEMVVTVMVGAIISLIGFIAFLIFSIFLSKGKGAFLIAGYNTMSNSEKDKYDEISLCKFMAKIMYGICFSILLWGLSDMLEIQILFIFGLILFLSIIVFAIVYSNTGNRFKKNF